ncbi:MAG TPA: dihydrofolate reductase [Flavobacteriales bacterium]|nr:dihydrofolate reductase [Flavobacteriales bacterium]
MKISVIVAIAKNNAIGKNNQLLWHLPADMKYFKEKTMGHCVLTGRKNFESIPPKFRPLPGRTNIVVTREKNYNAQGVYVVDSVEAGIEFARSQGETELFIIGGGQIYMECMVKNLVDTLYVTHVNGVFEADTYFPAFNPHKWHKTLSQSCPADEKHAYSYEFAVYNKVKKS